MADSTSTTTQEISHRYQSYMIRLWQDDLQTEWRASAQSVQTGEVIRFSNLDGLFEFLQSQLNSSLKPEDDDNIINIRGDEQK